MPIGPWNHEIPPRANLEPFGPYSFARLDGPFSDYLSFAGAPTTGMSPEEVRLLEEYWYTQPWWTKGGKSVSEARWWCYLHHWPEGQNFVFQTKRLGHPFWTVAQR